MALTDCTSKYIYSGDSETVQDKILTCRDCGQEFVFTAGEQEFYAEKGFGEPGRCSSCRAARKAGRGEGGYSRPREYSSGGREMHAAVCARCGKPTQVPFEPRAGRPVYCSDCFAQERPAAGGGRDRRFGGGGGGDRSGGLGRGRGRDRDRREDRYDRW